MLLNGSFNITGRENLLRSFPTTSLRIVQRVLALIRESLNIGRAILSSLQSIIITLVNYFI